jgi:hypothetical protein
MDGSDDRREFARLRHAVPVRYKFLSGSVKDPEMETVFEGSTINVSLGGLLLVGPIGKIEWLKDLLLGHIQVGVNLSLPTALNPVKALTRLSWIEAKDPDTISFRLGLRILDISPENRGALSEFLSRETRIP